MFKDQMAEYADDAVVFSDTFDKKRKVFTRYEKLSIKSLSFCIAEHLTKTVKIPLEIGRTNTHMQPNASA